jgi:peroxiredoxin
MFRISKTHLFLFIVSLVAIPSVQAAGPLQKALEEKAGGSTEMSISNELEQMAHKAASFQGKLPDHTFSSGEKLKDFYTDGPLVLTFYRGHWCPYCTLELKEYENLHAKFTELGATVLAVTPDLPMQVKKTKVKYNLSFSLISDKDHALAKKLGLAFKLDDKTLKLYKSYGIDLAGSQGNKGDTLPLPGTYVVDKDGVVVYAFVDPNYKKRAEPVEVLEVVEGIQVKE